MEKSPEAFRTISEVAEAMALPQHVLRFWETRFPQIRPLKRAGGRRYYRPDDVERLRLIKRLLYDEGYTIKGVQKLFKEQGAQALMNGAFDAQADSGRGGLKRVRSFDWSPIPPPQPTPAASGERRQTAATPGRGRLIAAGDLRPTTSRRCATVSNTFGRPNES